MWVGQVVVVDIVVASIVALVLGAKGSAFYSLAFAALIRRQVLALIGISCRCVCRLAAAALVEVISTSPRVPCRAVLVLDYCSFLAFAHVASSHYLPPSVFEGLLRIVSSCRLAAVVVAVRDSGVAKTIAPGFSPRLSAFCHFPFAFANRQRIAS